MPSTDSRFRLDRAIALLRVVIGIVFIAHGAQKVFVFGFAGVGGFFASIGVPAPAVMGPFVGLLELVGGAALVVGLLTRPAALLLACDMLGAMALVHIKNGFFLPSGVEFVLVLFAANLTLGIGGGGAYSLDAVLAGRRGGRAQAGTYGTSR